MRAAALPILAAAAALTMPAPAAAGTFRDAHCPFVFDVPDGWVVAGAPRYTDLDGRLVAPGPDGGVVGDVGVHQRWDLGAMSLTMVCADDRIAGIPREVSAHTCPSPPGTPFAGEEVCRRAPNLHGVESFSQSATNAALGLHLAIYQAYTDRDAPDPGLIGLSILRSTASGVPAPEVRPALETIAATVRRR